MFYSTHATRLRRRIDLRPGLENMEERITPTSFIAIGDAAVAEGNSGSASMRFTVTRTGDLGPRITVSYTTADGTARAGADYTAQAGDLVIPAGESSATIDVPVIGNTLSQPNRTFLVRLTGIVEVSPAPALVSFADRQDVAAGTSPQAIATGDFNGDGKLDIVVPNGDSNSLSVLINTSAEGEPNATFGPWQRIPIATRPRSVAVGDFNNDGKSDLVAVDYNSNVASVLLNTTAPGAASLSFTPDQGFPTGLGPWSVSVGDFNGDGRADLASANLNASSVSILLNTTPAGASTPSFADRRDFATGLGPWSVSVGDFNGDGRADLASANLNASSLSILLNTTSDRAETPSFAPRQDLSTGTFTRSVVVGDLNGDGKPDLTFPNVSVRGVSILLNATEANATSCTFAPRSDIATDSVPLAVSLGDFNGDGKADLVAASIDSNRLSVLVNTTAPAASTPSFADRRDFATGLGPWSIAVGDFNGDGRADLTSANIDSNNLSVFVNTTDQGAITRSTATGTILDDDTVGTARFVGSDSTTQGTWKGVYGAEGFSLSQDPSVNNPSIPSYATVTLADAAGYAWDPATADRRALQKAAPDSTDRIAGTWYSWTSMSFGVKLNDGKAHRVSLYALDWDWAGARSQTIDVLDTLSGAVLDTRTITGFQGGVYLSWVLSGDVTFRVTNNGPVNAVLSGIFFDGIGATARFSGSDAATQGNWKGAYGADGFSVSQDPSANNPSVPTYATVTLADAAGYVWDPATPDRRALQKAAPDSTDRIAGTWFTPTSMSIGVKLTDGKPHRVSLYALDWDGARSQTIEVIDTLTGAVLDTRSITGFQGGLYLSWVLTGDVTFRVTNNGPSNAVISGIFFDPPPG